MNIPEKHPDVAHVSDGDAPEGWKDGMYWRGGLGNGTGAPSWLEGKPYVVPAEVVYKLTIDDTRNDAEFDVQTWLAQGRANADKLPEGVVLPEPTDWAMEVAYAYANGGKSGLHGLAELIRTHCQPREVSNGGRISEERDANTRLIRAAPELLAACQAVVASAMRNEAYDLCVAAIAKATKP